MDGVPGMAVDGLQLEDINTDIACPSPPPVPIPPTPTPGPTPPGPTPVPNNTIPASFDSRTKWAGCVGDIRNQA